MRHRRRVQGRTGVGKFKIEFLVGEPLREDLVGWGGTGPMGGLRRDLEHVNRGRCYQCYRWCHDTRTTTRGMVVG